MTRTIFAAGLVVVASVAVARAAVPLPRVKVVPVYSTSLGVRLSWVEEGGADFYTIHRQVDGGSEKAVVTASAGPRDNDISYLDEGRDLPTKGLVATSTYTYRVEVCAKSECAFTELFTTSPRVVWPIAGGREVMHGFNEVSGWNGIGAEQVIVGGKPQGLPAGYHMGVDLNKTTGPFVPGDLVVAPRGGIVNDVRITGVDVDNGAIGVKVDVGDGDFEYDTFNHIATVSGAPSVAPGDVVAPGQVIARIGTENNFSGNFAKHVHFQQERSPIPVGQQRVIRHPLAVFTDPADRDPLGNPPALVDENDDKKSVLYRDHATGNLIPYDYATTPLRGDVDVEPEVVDVQGTKPGQAPIDLGYWIEGPLPDTEQRDDVKSAAHPYRLYDFRVEYFGGIPTTTPKTLPVPCDFVADIADVANAGCGGLVNCTDRPAAGIPCGSVIEEDGIDWKYPVLHHFIVTHASGETGARAEVDGNQYWRTAAKDGGPAVDSEQANYATQPTTTKAWEARFPDGDYKIHVIASDLVHANVDLPLPPARLENFAPFVKEMQFARDLDKNPATGLPNFPGCEHTARYYRHKQGKDPLNPENLIVAADGIEKIARSGHKVCIDIRFSEPVANVVVDLVTKRGAGDPIAGSAFTGALARTHQDNDTWRGTLVVPADPTGASDATFGSEENDVALRIRATDRRDAAGATRTLDADGDGVPDPGDVNHVVLRLDSSPPSATLDVVKP